MKSLSKRGRKLAENPARIDMELFFEADQNRFHPTENPKGCFPLNVAENTVSVDMIKTKLEKIVKENKIPGWVMKYTSATGHPAVKEIVADFMNTYFKNSSITSDNIAFSAGASASLEVISFLLANPGDVVVIPAPSYPMYTKDLGVKSLVERYDLQTHFEIKALSSLARVNSKLLDNTLLELQAKGKRFKILLLTSPDNPSESIYSETQLIEISDWCINRNIHLIVNEIYALSQFDSGDQNTSQDFFDFVSFAKIMAAQKSDYLHFIYALSKDFSASGLRFGIIHSLNQKFLQALENVNIPHMVSNLTQWIVGEMFRDKLFIENYVKENKRRISETYLLVSRVLESLEIPFVPNKGSLFIWADFSKYLVGDSPDAEMNLWVHIFKETGVLLTPGIGFQHKKNGLFRIVHTAVPAPHLQMAMDKLYSYLKKRPVSKSDYF